MRPDIICNITYIIWAKKAQRFTLEMDCHMDFHLFPFDYQLCPVELESYGHTTSDIMFKWIGERSILYGGSGTNPLTMGELVLSDKYINPTCINEYRFWFEFW